MASAIDLGVFGAGAWGTALAILLARNGHRVQLWGRDPETMARMQAERRNARYLPDAAFPDNLQATADIAQALHQAKLALIVIPSEGFRAFLRLLAPHFDPAMRIAWATKGLELGTAKRLDEVVEEELPAHLPPAVISGPTFAREVAAGLPTAVTVASRDCSFAEQLSEWLHNPHFRAYRVDDVIGVELGGALKNVLAIAAGIADGLHFGANTRAALITRGLAEITRLGVHSGARRETFMGLAGLGDLVLTCTDNQSRNRRFGLHLAEGMRREEALEAIGQTVEGLPTAREAWALAQRHGVEMPISEAVYRVLYEGLPAKEAVHELLARNLRRELDD